MLRSFVALLALLLVAVPLLAQDAPEAPDPAVQKFIASLKFESGTIALPEAKATLKLQSDMRFLRSADAERVLTQLWGNPPGTKPLGLLLPTADTLTDPDGYAVVVTYNDDGYVSDEEAAKVDYDKMLKEMQASTTEENAERKKAGYGAVELVAWADRPRYDSTSNKIYWAKRLKFEGTKQDTLNYDVRVLGRGGYLSLNAVAGIDQLGTIKTGMPRLIELTEFDPGARYADYTPGTDKLAAYGIAALVAGGVAAKAGLFSKLFVLLLAAKKFVIVLLLGIAAGFKKILGMFRRKEA